MLRLLLRSPITLLFLGLNLGIFVLNRAMIMPPIVAMPDILNMNTFLAHVSHIWPLHFVLNMFVFIQISPLIERRMHPIGYLGALLTLWVLVVALTFPFLQTPVLGFSGIIMGLLTLTIGIYRQHKAFALNLSKWLVLNIAIGLLPQISFLGHAMGAVAGAMVFVVLWGMGRVIKN